MPATVASAWLRHGVNQLCPLCRAKLPCGCGTLYGEAATLWTRADRGYGDRGSQFRQADGLCQRVVELDSSHAGAIGLLGQCYQDGLGLELCKRTALGLLEKAMKINVRGCVRPTSPYHSDITQQSGHAVYNQPDPRIAALRFKIILSFYFSFLL